MHSIEPSKEHRAWRADLSTTGMGAAAHEVASSPDLVEEAGRAAGAARDFLLSQQQADGHWVAELEGDSILESEYVILLAFLGKLDDPRVPRLCEHLRRTQSERGGWANHPGGGTDVSASVKAYFVLKLMGDDPASEPMRRARQAILDAGGIEACNSYTKIYLAICGQYSWNRCVVVPPGMMFFPRWFPFNIYEMSSWSRAIVVPLSIIWAHKPVVSCPVRIDELMVPGQGWRAHISRFTGGANVWTRFFEFGNWGMQLVERLSPVKPLRRTALRKAERWIRERCEMSGGLAAIFPSIVNTVIAFRCLGHGEDDPVVRSQLEELERLEIHDGETMRVQPCFSPVWDTALSINALAEAGVDPDDEQLRAAARWLLDREVRHKGDWAVKLKDVEAAGWYFEYANEWYPDCDDTAEVLTALTKVRLEEGEEERKRAAMDRAVAWVRAMQNEDGGWAAFDRDCQRQFLNHVPFADHNAMLDPSCEDITGRLLETWHLLGHDRDDEAMPRAIAWLLDRQAPDGSWYGRWGCNYLYGTWLVLWGMSRIGVDMDSERVRAAADWVESVQQPCGGWGESPRSYDEPETKGQGPVTPSQTSWAILSLIAAGRENSEAVRRGIRWLCQRQRSDGGWDEEPWTGTGFPRVFYLRYHLYSLHFPLLALATWAHARGGRAQ